jgi:hypothetical protein
MSIAVPDGSALSSADRACRLRPERKERERLARPGRPARNDGVRNNGEERRRRHGTCMQLARRVMHVRSRRRRHKRDGGRAEGAVLCACMMHAVDTHEFLFVAILFYLGTRQLIHHHKKGQGKKKQIRVVWSRFVC